ncbi:MAG: tripartite tricarboxylate transporter substrate binding protein [Burkholderiaceae bacterium]
MNGTRMKAGALRAAALAALGVLAAIGGVGSEARAESSLPQRTITMVVPTTPAGGTDAIGRMLAEEIGKRVGRTVVIENKPGANGIVGVESVAKGPADGSRLLFTYAASMVVNPALYRKLPYDTLKDFAPVAQVGRGGNLLLVRPDIPARTLAEFVAFARSSPQPLNYCSWGAGSGGHLAMESLKKQAGIDMAHVAYKGSAPCVQDLIGGQVDAGFADSSTTVEIVRSGRVRALAYSGSKRLPMLPGVPTMNEAGYPFTNYPWYGVFAPAATPPKVVDELNQAVTATLKDPAIIKRLRDMNFDDLPQTTPQSFAETIRKDLADWRALVEAVGVKLD